MLYGGIRFILEGDNFVFRADAGFMEKSFACELVHTDKKIGGGGSPPIPDLRV